MGTLAKSEDPDEMPQNALFARTKLIFRARNTILFEIITCDPLIIYNEPSQVCCIKPRKNPFVHNGVSSHTTFMRSAL